MAIPRPVHPTPTPFNGSRKATSLSAITESARHDPMQQAMAGYSANLCFLFWRQDFLQARSFSLEVSPPLLHKTCASHVLWVCQQDESSRISLFLPTGEGNVFNAIDLQIWLLRHALCLSSRQYCTAQGNTAPSFNEDFAFTQKRPYAPHRDRGGTSVPIRGPESMLGASLTVHSSFTQVAWGKLGNAVHCYFEILVAVTFRCGFL